MTSRRQPTVSSRITGMLITAAVLAGCQAGSQPDTSAQPATKTLLQGLVAGEIPTGSTIIGEARFPEGLTHTITLTRDPAGDIRYVDTRVSTPLATELRIVAGSFYLQGLNGPATTATTTPPILASDATTTATSAPVNQTAPRSDDRGPWINGADAAAYLPSSSGSSAPTLEWLVEEVLSSTLQVSLSRCTADVTLTAEPTQLKCGDDELTAALENATLTLTHGASTLRLTPDTTDVTAPSDVLSKDEAAAFLARRNDQTNAVAATTSARSFAAAHRMYAASLKLELNDPALLDAHLKSKESYLSHAVRELLPSHLRVLVLTDTGWVRLCTDACDPTARITPSAPLCFALHQNRATAYTSFPTALTIDDPSVVSPNPAIGCPAAPPTAPTGSSYRDLGATTPASDPSW